MSTALDSRGHLHLPRLLTGLQQRLRANELPMRALLADAGYANGTNYARLEAAHITAWIPVFGQYKAEIEGFSQDCATDAFTCVKGKKLSFQKYDTNQDGGWRKIYWPPAATASSARANRRVPRGPGTCKSPAPFTTRPTAGPGSAKARSNRCLGTYCPTTACAG